MTPEGKVKAAVSRVLSRYHLYTFMPVPSGYGQSSLDYIICFRGLFIAIEAKKPGGKMTNRQKMIAEKIKAAGGRVFLIEGENGLNELKEFLEHLHASSCQSEA
jgi:hypothetical protein